MTQSVFQTETGSYFNQKNSVPVGDTFEAYSGEEGSVAQNDLVVFDDPDAGMHVNQCPLVMNHEFVGWVRKVYAFDPSFRDSISPEVGTTGALGRLSISDNYTHVIPTEGNTQVRGRPLKDEYDGPMWAFNLAEQFYEGEYEKSFQRESHGGWSAVGKDTAEEIRACQECIENEHGPTYTRGE